MAGHGLVSALSQSRSRVSALLSREAWEDLNLFTSRVVNPYTMVKGASLYLSVAKFNPAQQYTYTGLM